MLAAGHEALKAAIPTAAVAWADESTHKVDGASGYLWLVMTRRWCSTRPIARAVRRSRSGGFRGSRARGRSRSASPSRPRRPGFTIASRGSTAAGAAAQERPATAERNARAIKGDLKTLATDVDLAENADVARLQRRIVRHLPELVTFITNPDLEGTNNRAEREFRPHAIGRHRSGCPVRRRGEDLRDQPLGRAHGSPSPRRLHRHLPTGADRLPRGRRLSEALPRPARDARQVVAPSLSQTALCNLSYLRWIIVDYALGSDAGWRCTHRRSCQQGPRSAKLGRATRAPGPRDGSLALGLRGRRRPRRARRLRRCRRHRRRRPRRSRADGPRRAGHRPDAQAVDAPTTADAGRDGGADAGPTLVSVSHEREFRAAWVATVFNIDWPSRTGLSAAAAQAELAGIVDVAARNGLNALVFQVRPEGDALYRSALEPWSRFLTGRQGLTRGGTRWPGSSSAPTPAASRCTRG
nr:transposase [Deltaproteobacteria bacterium]